MYLTTYRPIILIFSFGHCASLQHGNWEVGVYHCDSLFSDTNDTSWVKLVTVSR